MARHGWNVLYKSAVLFTLLDVVSCGYNQIDLRAPSTQCNMSTTYSGSLDCTGALNGNTNTTWVPGINCIYTDNARVNYWLVNLGSSHNIHRITVYPEVGWDLMRSTIVEVDDRGIYTFDPDNKIQETTYIMSNTTDGELPIAGQIIKFTKQTAGYVTLCELHVDECSETTHGAFCNQTCSTNCQDTKCDSITARCITGCVDGWYNATCSTQCPTGCAGACDRDSGVCNGCKAGWHGDRCNVECSETCQTDGSGQRPCGQHDGSCVEGCKAGWHGDRCNVECSETCQTDGSGQRPCGQHDGSCVEGCVEGWYDDTCSTQCPTGCAGACDRDSGICNGCKAGWHGDRCDVECSPKCRTDGNGRRPCEQHNGTCTEGCVEGWYNATCSTPCPPGCADECERNSGVCNGCNASWHGERCDVECSPNCQTDDNGQNPCQQDNGTCTEGCVEGWYNVTCSTQCPTGCAGACDRDNGVCNGCKAGWHGNTCEVECNLNCRTDDNGQRPCQQHDGTCTEGCVEEWYGPACSLPCPNNCNGPCDGVTGICSKCTGSMWSVNCTEECGHCGGDGSCDIDTGNCNNGCMEGFSGPNCTLKLTSDAQQETNAGAVAGGVIGAAVVIAAVIIGVLLFRRRRLNARKDGENQNENEAGRTSRTSADRLMNVETEDPQKSANKPKAHVRPLSREQPDGQETAGNSSDHIYTNTSALSADPAPQNGASGKSDRTRGSSSASKKTPSQRGGDNAPGKPSVSSKPAVPSKTKSAASPSTGASGDKLYENMPASNASDSRSSKKPLDLSEVDDKDVYNSEDIYSSSESLTSPLLDDFQRYLIQCLASGKLSEQFADLPKGMKHPHNAGMTDENNRKNRFKALSAYDHNRVILHWPEGDNSSDYINATYIKGCQREKQYIATQGPRQHTVNDLWWMVWQEGVNQIVMLCNLKEDGKDKCDEYWPAPKASKTCGHVTVTGCTEEPRADFVIRTFSLQVRGSGPRHVTQHHYHAWPDHGVPKAASLVDFWRCVKGRNTSPDVPLLVHCSAGVGRTGTFIALDIASDFESRGHEVNVNEIVTQLREERCLMVQSEAQYKFLHEAILEAHTSRSTRIPMSQFEVIFPDTIGVHKENKWIDTEFQMLQHMGQYAPKPSHTMASDPENLDKNRNMDALPDDDHMVYLNAYVRGRNQYISAVYLPSFRHRHGFVLTQLPIPNKTLVDFWRLVHGCDVTTIVSIGSNDEEESIMNYCRFWPHGINEVLNSGPYTITTNAILRRGASFVSYRMTLKSKTEEGLEREVELLHYTDWTGEVAGDTSCLLELVATLTDSASHSKKSDQPVIVQCIDGAAKSGLFCVLHDVISRLTCDSEVDIYLTARQLQRVRPQAMATLTEYRFLYKAVQEHIRGQNIYANT